MAHFFIDRPIFAWVIAIMLMLAGALSITRLPVSRFPNVAPPTITIHASYPGASAKVIEDSVTQIIEQKMKGLDNLLFMSSTSEAAGRGSVALTFNSGVNPDIAQVQVQNKLQLAMPLLPQAVQQQGINVEKTTSSYLMSIAFLSEDGKKSTDDIGDFIGTNIIDALSRVAGVGSVQLYGAQYAMRIWLDPDKLTSYKLSPADVVAAIKAQNQQVAIGQLGGTPSVPGQQLNATIDARGRLQTPEQFRNIVVRGSSGGSVLRLSDIARVELGAEDYNVITRLNGVPASGVSISLATGANAVATSAAIRLELEKLKSTFPAGIKATIAFDTTPFISVAIRGVVETLVEAVVLVFLVMYLFLQNFRATLIPTIAVPVVLLGTFAGLQVLGFSINMLTMFAMVLAIGLLVDDAIVVIENVERLMTDEGLSPLEATRKSMHQISGALVAIGLVLSAVFIPMAFIGGITGVIYQQFAATIVVAIVLSVLMALILTPALCATLLKPVEKNHNHQRGGLFGWFNRFFARNNSRYQGRVRRILSTRKRFMVIYVAFSIAAAALFFRLPTGFIPDEDQGWLMTLIQTPVGATQERTMNVIKQMEDHFLSVEKDKTLHIVYAIQGFSFNGSGQNSGLAFITLKDWSERKGEALSVKGIVGRAMAKFGQIKDGFVFAVAPPPIPELGTSTGYAFFLTDTRGIGHEALMAARNQFLGAAAQSKLLANVRPAGMEDTPQLRIDIDNAKAAALGLDTADINDALAIAWGGRYIDDFVDRGRVKRVYVQADAPFRMVPEDFRHWTVKNAEGQLVPFSAFANWRWDYGSPRLERYNGLPALQINGEAAPGESTGTAMAEIERIVAGLPPGIGLEWTGVSFLERAVGAQTNVLYAISLVFVFLCLAALYESWTIPTAVLMVAPLGVLGAVLANTARGMERDIYFQVAMLTTVGLTSKNAILIVEFAKINLEQGMEVIEATMTAVRDRLRPIVMTSLAFGMGVLPLAIASGAGSGAQQAIGTGVLGGMVIGTFLGIFFIPLFFVVVQRLFNKNAAQRNATAPHGLLEAPAGGGDSHE